MVQTKKDDCRWYPLAVYKVAQLSQWEFRLPLSSFLGIGYMIKMNPDHFPPIWTCYEGIFFFNMALPNFIFCTVWQLKLLTSPY